MAKEEKMRLAKRAVSASRETADAELGLEALSLLEVRLNGDCYSSVRDVAGLEMRGVVAHHVMNLTNLERTIEIFAPCRPRILRNRVLDKDSLGVFRMSPCKSQASSCRFWMSLTHSNKC